MSGGIYSGEDDALIFHVYTPPVEQSDAWKHDGWAASEVEFCRVSQLVWYPGSSNLLFLSLLSIVKR